MSGVRRPAVVKRRPLPSNPNSGTTSPAAIITDVGRPTPPRAGYGPRELRQNSFPPESTIYPPVQDSVAVHGYLHGHDQRVASDMPSYGHAHVNESSTGYHGYSPSNQHYDDPVVYQQDVQYDDYAQQSDLPAQPDFLPQLPPSSRQRQNPLQQNQQIGRPAQPPAPPGRPYGHVGLLHSQSAPVVPLFHADESSFDAYAEPIPDLDFQHRQIRSRRSDVPPGWENPYDVQGVAVIDTRQQSSQDEDAALPPPPPMHSISAPAVPQFTSQTPPSQRASAYDTRTPPSGRQQYLQNASPLQSLEPDMRSSANTPPRGLPARSRSGDDMSPLPLHPGYDQTPSSLTPGQSPSPYSRTPPGRQLPHRHSVADTYGSTPPRRHPLAQEVPRAASPQPYYEPQYQDSAAQQHEQPQYEPDYRHRDAAPLIKPRAVSPQPPRPKSMYSIQHPVRAFASSSPSDAADPRTSRLPNRSTPTRKSVSPRPLPETSRSSIPFSPDSFDVHNPTARASPLAAGSSSHSPYQVRPDPESHREESRGPIVGWDGREIDPSDHLPVDSWAPEPEKKTPTKTYGVSGERPRGLSGPRTAQPLSGSGGRVSRDMVVNVRRKDQSSEPDASPRNRLQKKNAPARSPVTEPLRELDNYNSVPNPYAQQEYSRGFRDGSPGVSDSFGSRYDDRGYGPPSLPPKVPLQQEYGPEALSRELSSIDIGSGRGRNVPAPTAYVPVKSHRRDYY